MEKVRSFITISVRRDLHKKLKVAATRKAQSIADYIEELHDGF